MGVNPFCIRKHVFLFPLDTDDGLREAAGKQALRRLGELGGDVMHVELVAELLAEVQEFVREMVDDDFTDEESSLDAIADAWTTSQLIIEDRALLLMIIRRLSAEQSGSCSKMPSRRSCDGERFLGSSPNSDVSLSMKRRPRLHRLISAEEM